MKNLSTKKNLLISSGITALVIVLIIALLPSPYRCGVYEKMCKYIGDGVLTLIISIPLFLFSLITYFMRNEVYQAWWKLTRFWIPLSIFLVLLMPEDNGAFLPIDKGHVAILMSGLFAILSTVIILIAHFSLHKTKS